jgi:hypothetical protein
MTQSRHVSSESLLLRSLLSPVVSLLYLASAHSNLAFNGLAEAAMAFFWRCAGVLARITLPSLPLLSCPCCRRCAGIVTKLAFKSPAGAVLAFAGVALAFCLHCAGVIACIMLSSLPPALCQHRCHCHAGAFALLCWHCCPRRLCIAASIANWHLPSHEAVATCAGVIASIAPPSLPALCRHCCPHLAGVFALVALASPPSSHPSCLQHHKLASAQS